jgi:predicted nucleic acid-binding protein
MSSAPTASEQPAIYVDTSAFVKLVVREAESDALRDKLRALKQVLISSSVLEVEAMRAARHVGLTGRAIGDLEEALDEILLLGMTDAIRQRAKYVDPSSLRSLDAIHLATALEADVDVMVAYDQRLGKAARANGLAVMSPGA